MESLKMEIRVKQFSELHNNKWFHVMNWTIDIIKTSDKTKKYWRKKYDPFTSSFYF
jgi:hypothetical protein